MRSWAGYIRMARIFRQLVMDAAGLLRNMPLQAEPSQRKTPLMDMKIAKLETKKASGSLTEDVYLRLRADFLTCRILPGARLKVNELAGKLEVHVGAVREALFRLTSEGFVLNIPQRGFAAAPISVKELIDLTDARVEIESLCLRRSIAKGDLAWEMRIVAAEHALANIPKRDPRDAALISENWNNADTEYNEALVAACDNRVILQLRRQLRSQSERYRRLSYPLAVPERNVDYKKITRAVLSRDGDLAARILSGHIKDVAEILLKATKRLKIPDGLED
jgi:DNA-binding GntR family transcriptional regulator